MEPTNGHFSALPTLSHTAAQGAPHQKLVVIGDIHGHIDKLTALWENLEKTIGVDEFKTYLVVFLGDYVDRGPNPRAVIDFLINLKNTRPNTAFIAGNHEFAMCGFLGLLRDSASGSSNFEHTWNNKKIYVRPGEQIEWYSGPGFQEMHLQGRRWGGGKRESLYNASTTCKSYGVQHAHRSALLAAMPTSHKEFLSSLPWIHEIPGFIFVHAGFESGTEGYSGMTIEQQLQALRDRTIVPRPEMLCGREHVIDTPTELRERNICVISGHHNTVHYGAHRIIMDRSGGYHHGTLQALVLPSMLTIDHTGEVLAVDAAVAQKVFQTV